MSMSRAEAVAFSELSKRVESLEAKQKAGPVTVKLVRELSPTGTGKRRGARPKDFSAPAAAAA